MKEDGEERKQKDITTTTTPVTTITTTTTITASIAANRLGSSPHYFPTGASGTPPASPSIAVSSAAALGGTPSTPHQSPRPALPRLRPRLRLVGCLCGRLLSIACCHTLKTFRLPDSHSSQGFRRSLERFQG